MWQFHSASFKCRRERAVTLKRKSSLSTWGDSLRFISMFSLNWAIFKVPTSLPQTLLHSWCSGLHPRQKLVLRQAPATYSKAPHTFLPVWPLRDRGWAPDSHQSKLLLSPTSRQILSKTSFFLSQWWVYNKIERHLQWFPIHLPDNVERAFLHLFSLLNPDTI